MRSIVFAAALGCAALSGAPALAQSPKTEQSASQSAEWRGLETWISEIALWAQTYQNQQNSQVAVMETAMTGLETALNYAESGDARGGRAWAQQWRAARERDLQALSSQLNGLDRTPPPLPPEVVAAAPELQTMWDRYQDLPAAYVRLNDEFIRDVRGIIETVAGVAGGDPAALDASASVVITRSIAMTRSSITLQETSLSLQPDPGHPQASILRVGIDGERALLALFQMMKLDLQGGAPNRAAIATEIRTRATAIEGHADAMTAAADERSQRLAREIPPGALRDRVAVAMRTYEDSAAIDRRYAQTLHAIARLVEQGEMLGSEALDVQLAAIDQISVERVETDNRRRNALVS